MHFKLSVLYHLLLLKWHKWWFRGRLGTLRNRHWKSLNKTLRSSDFYTDLARKESPLNQYPKIDKAVFMQNFTAINTVGVEKTEAFEEAQRAETSRSFSPTINGVTVGLSSGTSGNRGIFLATQTERAQWVAAVLDRVIGLSLRKRKVAFFLRANSNLYSSVKSRLLQFEFFDLLIPAEQHLDRLQALNPNILVAQPSLLLELAKYIKAGQLSIAPTKVISVAEVLTPEDKSVLEEVFPKPLHQVYQCTEGFLASSCTYGNLHFNEDFLVIECRYLDEQEDRFHPIITDLLRSSQPIIRYELNDIIHLRNTPCPCGSDWLTIDRIEGRSDDVFEFPVADETEIATRLKTVRIYPDFMRRAIILADPLIKNYEVIQVSPQQINLYIEGSEESYYRAEEALKTLLLNYGVCYFEVQKLVKPSPLNGRKLRRIRHENRKTR